MDTKTLPRWRQLLADANIPQDIAVIMGLAANREANMTGARFSDAIASQVADYQSDPAGYEARENKAREIVRNLGY